MVTEDGLVAAVGAGATERPSGGALQVREVSHAYAERRVLSDVSFEVPPGVLMGLLGPNGAGKTTLMRVMFGVIDPLAGETRWAGRPVTATDRLPLGVHASGAWPLSRDARGRPAGLPRPAARHGPRRRHQLGARPARGARPRRPVVGPAGQAVRRHAAAAAAGRRAGPRPRGDRARRAVRRARPGGGRGAVSHTAATGARRSDRAVLQPPARPGPGPVRVDRHARRRAHGARGPGRRPPGVVRPPAAAAHGRRRRSQLAHRLPRGDGRRGPRGRAAARPALGYRPAGRPRRGPRDRARLGLRARPSDAVAAVHGGSRSSWRR